MQSIVKMFLIIINVCAAVGCADVSRQILQGEGNGLDPSHPPQQVQDLAGIWEYADKTGSNTITLDEEGNGPYEWEGGWFETQELKDGVWKGQWMQAGNDREGRFELKWLDDSSIAQGRWWYTRIGQDHNPLDPGSTFTMQRISPFLTGGK
ncbi:hypothetical protein [Candidatus Nitrospira neomarina]|uniref:Uncharacterized protein n=1 Tax=Candidatus Nitrospira neomarina TaxID=3020899 RepID=A0AA96GF37_9BACT|nr:hypothetical protein [Candidatus Nitrospira neomarina]WNM60698.1 hypothetical protein PQG83_13115 [Candidatus Nitrospira neomarina]